MVLENSIGVVLAIIVATLGAIVYSLRVLILLERRIARMDVHLELLVKSVLKDETEIEEMLKKEMKKTRRR